MKKPPPGYAKMKNGLYSVHIQMGDGVKGRASGVIVLSYTAGAGTWKGDLVTRPIAAARRGRFLPDGRSRQAFPEHSGVTIPRFSAPRW
jgi:hypothetical protein